MERDEFKDVYYKAVPSSRLYEERIACSNDAPEI